MFLAERVGFEPTERFPVHSISSAASSTTPAPLLELRNIGPIGPIGLIFRQWETAEIHGGEGGIRTHGGR